MIYSEFEKIMTKARMSRYLIATDFNSRKAMTLYRKNLQLTQEMYTVLSCFEIALRNAIDSKLTAYLGPNWLISSTFKGGIFDNLKCKLTHKILNVLRNRMAHHEPICFVPGKPIKNTQYIRENYQLILQFFQWMQINETSLLYGLNHIDSICDEIDHL